MPEQSFFKSEERKKTRILIADDHLIVRRGIKGLIDDEDDLTVVAEAGNGEEAVLLSHETLPDVIIMDFNMPVMNGDEATKEVLLTDPSIKVIGLSLNNHTYVRSCMLSAGASAYISKGSIADTLCSTIRNVVNLTRREAGE